MSPVVPAGLGDDEDPAVEPQHVDVVAVEAC